MRRDRRLVAAIKRDFRHAVRLDRPTLFALFHAIVELAIARISLSTRQARELLEPRQASPIWKAARAGHTEPSALIDDVSFAIPRMGARVPWRSDCLVQALAAQRWLRNRGVATSLVIGVRKPTPADFEAHAWLMAGDRVVAGGEVSSYHTVLKQKRTE